MLIFADLFKFKVIEALVLRIASYERQGSFTQIVFQKAVAGADKAGVLSLIVPDWCCDQARPAYLARRDWLSKRLMSPISAIIPAE